MATNTVHANDSMQHAALWLIGPDMPGLLRLGSEYVASRGGNIDKDIADKFGEKAVVFMSITAEAADIRRMADDTPNLKEASGCGVVFQPMHAPTVPAGFKDELYGFDIVTEDQPGIVAEITALLAKFGMMIVGHTGERRVAAGPIPKIEGGQKYVVMLPHDFDRPNFTLELNALVKKFNGRMVTPLQVVPGLLWWW